MYYVIGDGVWHRLRRRLDWVFFSLFFPKAFCGFLFPFLASMLYAGLAFLFFYFF